MTRTPRMRRLAAISACAVLLLTAVTAGGCATDAKAPPDAGASRPAPAADPAAEERGY